MSVTDEQVVWLRARLTGELQEAQRVSASATANNGVAGIGALVYAALIVAARRKFAPEWTRAEVTRFVTTVRRLLSDQPDALDPLIAEQELRNALGENLTNHAGTKARGRAQYILLNALVQSLDLNGKEVAGLLGQARGIADTLLEPNRGGQPDRP